jgi:hypothetical protein
MDQTDDARRAQAQHEMALAQHQHEVDRIVEIGRQTFGSKQFDEDSAVFAEALGDKTLPVMAALRQFDAPHAIVKHLADNPRRLAEIAKMPDARQIVELARIESQAAPHGHTETSREPAWKASPPDSSRVSDEEWRANGGSRLTDDQWTREFNRRHKERFGTVPR